MMLPLSDFHFAFRFARFRFSPLIFFDDYAFIDGFRCHYFRPRCHDDAFDTDYATEVSSFSTGFRFAISRRAPFLRFHFADRFRRHGMSLRRDAITLIAGCRR
jgi:hypothetical protein